MSAGAATPSSERGALLPVSDALDRVLALVRPTGVELAAIDAAGERVLARSQQARRTQPPFDAAQMDGYAVNSADAAAPGAALQVVGEVAAGADGALAIAPGEAARIFTGAPMPAGADAVALQEDARRDGDAVTLSESVEAGQFVRRAGHDFREGQELLAAPRVLSPSDVALAAAMGLSWLPVRRRPRVALLGLGDELRLPGEPLGPGQIVSSNSYGVAALLRRCGAEPVIFPTVPDRLEAVRAALVEAARGGDLIVTMGGASDGDHDLVKPALRAEGAAPDFYKVAMRPGKPLMAATLGATPVLGLPGNPVSTMVCAQIFLRPMIAAMLGLPAGPAPRVRLTLGADLGANGPREHYMRARLTDGPVGRVAFPAEDQDSALLSVMASAEALLARPPHDPPRRAGEPVECIIL